VHRDVRRTGALLVALRDAVLALSDGSLAAVASAVRGDPLIGPSLMLPGRTWTRADMAAGNEIIQSDPQWRLEPLQCNLERIISAAERMVWALDEATGYEDVADRLRAALESVN